ncbi:hypothetical protein E4U55_000792 [Claviceps digitariae]|nr:hypothetical protein E4U55_000792 [Claviceps digitariae]
MSEFRIQIEANKARICQIHEEILFFEQGELVTQGMNDLAGGMSPRTQAQLSESASSAAANRGLDEPTEIP